MECGEQQRQRRLGDPGARGHRRGEGGQALVGAQALEQWVEERAVHDERPEHRSGGGHVSCSEDAEPLAEGAEPGRAVSVLDEDAPGADVGGAVPGVAEARDLDVRPGVRCVDEPSAADVHADVADAVEEDEVAGAEGAARVTRTPWS